MANEQLKRAIEFFLELRFSYFFNQSSVYPVNSSSDGSLSDFQQMMKKMSKALNSLIDICRMVLRTGTGELSKEKIQEVLKAAEEAFLFIKSTNDDCQIDDL